MLSHNDWLLEHASYRRNRVNWLVMRERGGLCCDMMGLEEVLCSCEVSKNVTGLKIAAFGKGRIAVWSEEACGSAETKRNMNYKADDPGMKGRELHTVHAFLSFIDRLF
jgi:hypothetical protein